MKLVFYISSLYFLSFVHTASAQYFYWEQIADFDYVSDIKVNSEGDIFVCPQESGGIRRSTDEGTSWEFLYIAYSHIGNLAINESGHIFASDRYRLYNSIFRSEDNGNTWTQCSLTGGRMTALHISNQQYIYAGNDDGKFFRSFNNGGSWSSVQVLDKQINSIGTCSTGMIFIGTNQSGVYTSTDSGSSWNHLSNINGTVTAIAVNDSDYVFASNGDFIYVSMDYGSTWLPAGDFTLISDLPLGIDSAGTVYTCSFHMSKSTDNGMSWQNMGGPIITAIETFGRRVYVAGNSGVYFYDPDFIPPAYEADYFPLCTGNKWLYYIEEIFNMESFAYSLDTLEVIADTIISGKKYFRTNEVNDWFRFSYEDQMLYLRWNDSDYVNMDFTKQPGQSFQQLTFNSHVLRNVNAVRGERQIFDSTLIYKGYRQIGYNSGSETRYTASFGETDFSKAFSSETPISYSYDRWVIQAILIDSTGAQHNYLYNHWPSITFNPLLYSMGTPVTFDLYVDHPYTKLPPNQISGGLNFIDSVIILGYYQKADSIITIDPLNIPSVYYNHYRQTFFLTDSLFTNGFDFHYKIRARDKGIIPRYDSDPDTGYYVLSYIDTSAILPIRFSPPADTIYVNSTVGVAPEIICSDLSSTPLIDSISIAPGANTLLHYRDSLGNIVNLISCGFLAADSLNLFEYELWYHPKTSPPYDPVLIKFDSVFQITQSSFDIELKAKLNNITIKSYVQSFKADWIVNAAEVSLLPEDYQLGLNYPNPFNPSTIIKYQIPEPGLVTIKLYDLLGNEVVTLLNEEKSAGYYQLHFNASGLSSGTYFYRMQAGSFTYSRKMLLLK